LKITIVTPHFNDFEGIKRTFSCLEKQSSDAWEWIIVDDFSNEVIKKSLKEFIQELNRSNIHLVLNKKKSNGSVCRNIGLNRALYDRIVFLDSDDIISKDFVINRLIDLHDFVVFKNLNIIDENGNKKLFSNVSSHYLEHFLNANFVWQTTAILWNKEFLLKIGGFKENLKRLQDIELSIRTLILGENYKIIDNEVDFYYCVAPINPKKRTVKLICNSVNYLITDIHKNYKLNKYHKSLVQGYYFLCVRYFCKSALKDDLPYLKESLKLFYIKKYMSIINYLKGLTFMYMYKYNMISIDYFIRLNRYFFKKRISS